jgi:hypothetical protein
MAEFVTKKENQRRLMVVIICAIFDTLAVAGLIFAIKGASDIEQGDRAKHVDTLQQLREELAEIRKERVLLERLYVDFSKHVGWNTEPTGTTDNVVATGLNGQQMRDFLKGRYDELTTKYRVSGLRLVDQNGEGTPLTIVELFNKLKELEDSFKGECATLEQRIKAEQGREQTEITATLTADQGLANQIKSADGNSGLVMDYQRLLKDYYQLQKAHDAELYGDGTAENRGLEGEAFKAQQALTELRKKNLRAKGELEAKRTEFRLRRDTIIHNKKEAEERKEPDGTILAVDLATNQAYIDLVHADRIFKGTRFRVYSLEKGGVKVDKGEVEVTVVREQNSSVVAITKMYGKDDPIRTGDKVYNEYYEKGKQRYIVIAGRLTGRLSNDEAGAVVKEFGDIYQEKVDERTSYVVLGEGYENSDAFKMAQEWGVKYLREKSLYDYLGVPHD